MNTACLMLCCAAPCQCCAHTMPCCAMCVCVHVNTQVYAHVHEEIYTLSTNMYLYNGCVYTCTHTYACLYTCLCTCLHMCLFHIHVYACLCIRLCTYYRCFYTYVQHVHTQVYDHICRSVRLCACLCTSLCTAIHMSFHTSIHMPTHMHMLVCTHRSTHTFVYKCLYVSVYTCLHMCPCTCLCTQMIYRFMHCALSNVPVTIKTSPASCTSDRATVAVLTQNSSQERLGVHHRLHLRLGRSNRPAWLHAG